ncbi:16S rRNA (adenine(1518)-N(6)/adenine(1519)-N(6))-dimethyltransferase RsmA [Candidatus Schneideria nysicola]|uniref:16S rRNA (adenine(1518)-N(6)/adenine(1519)-N(6))- dimethyltransferase RsmA n=1 Tax=Candidatus Schneideria nysicola TaxID=1081631 RepID=UPI001CAA5800|nr:16S rRNA (adenine(1518)-N(6)/adenine(1519)-N(6))-dimethyltransferase RsmA [Candidatus Schneideria nysicola]UAJ66088.1 16S rRNA (adenine(1518)-N(6)/adenine(1519)-N(6))-dimethyltransferase RsmA [Candidatus Schneideria nysicola]
MDHSIFYKNHKIKKYFGQHFLIDNTTINSIVSIINPQFDQKIVEIGPGFGALTKYISKYVSSMTVIEIDEEITDYLLNNPFFNKKLNIIKGNAIKINYSNLAKKLGQKIRLIGNLPYNISTSFLLHLFKDISYIEDMHFVLQKELVKRLIASPNSKDYGRISIITQYFCSTQSMIEISPELFKPIPKVSSMLIYLKPHINQPYMVKNLSNLSMITRLTFSQRRKKIRNSLSKLFNIQQLENMGINTNLRAENLNIKLYCQLANLLEL